MLTLSSLESRINEIYLMAVVCKHTSDRIHEELSSKVYKELNRRYRNNRLVYSNYMRGYAFGLITAKDRYIMQNLVEFCYLHEGKLYSTRKDSINPYWGDTLDGLTVSKCSGNFYWRNTDKPYTISEQ